LFQRYVEWPLGYVAKLFEDTLFHFAGGVVGKRNGQDVLEVIGVEFPLGRVIHESQFKEFFGEGVGFARPCRRRIYLEL
jgi:hypothetical protein